MFFRNGAVGFIDWLDGLVAGSQARNYKRSQENDAVAGRLLGSTGGPSPNDECSDYERDKTG
jgi:hypothetical protein